MSVHVCVCTDRTREVYLDHKSRLDGAVGSSVHHHQRNRVGNNNDVMITSSSIAMDYKLFACRFIIFLLPLLILLALFVLMQEGVCLEVCPVGEFPSSFLGEWARQLFLGVVAGLMEILLPTAEPLPAVAQVRKIQYTG